MSDIDDFLNSMDTDGIDGIDMKIVVPIVHEVLQGMNRNVIASYEAPTELEKLVWMECAYLCAKIILFRWDELNTLAPDERLVFITDRVVVAIQGATAAYKEANTRLNDND